MKKKFFTGVFIAAVVCSVVFAHLMLKHNGAECAPQSNLSAPIEIPDAGILKYQEAQFKKPAIVLFYVDWCTFCRRFMPIFGETAKDFNKNFDFVAVNCEYPENAEIVKNYKISVYPSVYIIDKDLDFDYQISYSVTESAEALKKELDKHLKLRAKSVK